MDRMLYVAMTGAQQAMRAQTAVANNLANVNTAGFKQDLVQFRAMPVYGPGHPSRVYAMAERPGVDFEPGAIQTTGRPLDVAVSGGGFIAVQAPSGAEAYTRAGDFQVTSGGILQTGAGHPVLGNGGPIAVPPYESIEIGSDGTVSASLLGGNGALVQLDRIKLVKPDVSKLTKGEDGLARMLDGTNLDPDAAVRVASGAIEGSNVNTVEALVQMIEFARHYETQVKMMTAAKEGDEATTQLLRLA